MMFPKLHGSKLRLSAATLALAALHAAAPGPCLAQDNAEPKTEPGMKLTFSDSTGQRDTVESSGVLLYVPSGQPPSAFLPAGDFTAVWEGFADIDLRDRYKFKAELNGSVTVEVNGEIALEANGVDGATEASKRVRMNKGLNTLKVAYKSPPRGDARLRLLWSSPDFDFEPVSGRALARTAGSKALAAGQQLRLGRQLFAEHRCNKCHAEFHADGGMAELQMDAPSFEGIGSRRGFEWMKQWILDPGQFRAAARMPRIFRGNDAEQKAAATAAWLASLTGDSHPPGKAATEGDPAKEGEHLFQALHCEACHAIPGRPDDASDRIPLTHVNRKFRDGHLAEFLKQPEAHYPWTRMPNFKLSDQEALRLAAFLRNHAGEASGSDAPRDRALIEAGRNLVRESGCLHCHSSPEKTEAAAVAIRGVSSGCLARGGSGAHPFYTLEENEREALQAFLKYDGARDSLERNVAVEFAARQSAVLNCRKCHGEYEGFPVLDILGGKLKPEWSERFIAGQVDYKPRTWIRSRMPAFASRARGLAHGMAMEHGHPPLTPEPPPIDKEAAARGHKMIGTDGGFSCIACHAVNEYGAAQVFESAGVNLGHTGERLLKPYFRHWLLNPLRLDPQTKMPVYFSGGESPLFDFYDGDAFKQIDAMWQYLRMGEDMPAPDSAP